MLAKPRVARNKLQGTRVKVQGTNNKRQGAKYELQEKNRTQNRIRSI